MRKKSHSSSRKLRKKRGGGNSKKEEKKELASGEAHAALPTVTYDCVLFLGVYFLI